MLLPFHLLVVVLANLHRGVCQSVSPNGTDPGFFTYPINPSMTVMSGQVLNIIWSTDFTAFDLYYELVTEQRPDDIPIQRNPIPSRRPPHQTNQPFTQKTSPAKPSTTAGQSPPSRHKPHTASAP